MKKTDTPAVPAAGPISLRAFAKLQGVSAEAVSKAVADGRLRESVVHVKNKPKIADPVLAKREWDESTRPRGDRTPDDAVNAAYHASRAKREEADARRSEAQAELAELELAEKRGELVNAEEMRGEMIKAFSLVKTRLQAVPNAVGQRLSHVAGEVVPVVEELIREALEELADRGNGSKAE